MNLDEWFDSFFARKAAAPIASLCHRYAPSITPDRITAAVALFGLILAPFYGGGGYWPIVGALLFVWVMVLDCADGQLARLRGGGSWQGRVVDGLADMIGAVSCHVGMMIALATGNVKVLGHTFGWTSSFMLLLIAGGSMIWNARVFDGLKQNVKPESIDNDLERYRGEVKTLFDRFVFWCWEDYASHISGYKGETPEHTYLMLRRVQWAGPTNHHFLMVLTGFAMPWFPFAPVVYAFACIVPINLLVVGVLKLTRPAVGSFEATR